MDRIDPIRRSWLMSRVKGSNTSPELRVRKFLHRQGYRFSLHKKTLPGTPDLALNKHRLVIFVHGCFWHRHPGCSKASLPKSNDDFWRRKFEANVLRDKHNKIELEARGWLVHVVWECETKKEEDLRRVLSGVLPVKAPT